MNPKRKFWKISELAAKFRITERTLRNYCTRGLIPEARRKRGSTHWRIPLELSWHTKSELRRKSKIHKKEMQKIFPRTSANVARHSIGDGINEELGVTLFYARQANDTSTLEDAIDMALSNEGAVAHEYEEIEQKRERNKEIIKIHRLVTRRAKARKIANHVLEFRYAAEAVRREPRRVTIEAVARKMKVHKATLYRRHGREELNKLLRMFLRVGGGTALDEPQQFKYPA